MTEITNIDLIKESIKELGEARPISYVKDVVRKLNEEGKNIEESRVRDVLRKQMGNHGVYSVSRQPDKKLVIRNNNYKIIYLEGYNFDEILLENRAEEMRKGIIGKLSLEEVATASYDSFDPPKVLPILERYFQDKGLNIGYDSLEGVLKLKPTGFEFIHERAVKLLENRYRSLFDLKDKLKESGESKEKLKKMDDNARFLQVAISAERAEPIPPIWRLKRSLVSKSLLSEKEQEHFVGQIHYWLGKEGGKFTSELEYKLGKSFLEVRHSLEILACLPEEMKNIKHCPYVLKEPDYKCISFKEMGPIVEMVDTSQLVRISKFGEEYRGLALEALRKHGEINIGEKEFRISLPNKEEIVVLPLEEKIKKDQEFIGVESASKIINDAWKIHKENILL